MDISTIWVLSFALGQLTAGGDMIIVREYPDVVSFPTHRECRMKGIEVRQLMLDQIDANFTLWSAIGIDSAGFRCVEELPERELDEEPLEYPER